MSFLLSQHCHNLSLLRPDFGPYIFIHAELAHETTPCAIISPVPDVEVYRGEGVIYHQISSSVWQKGSLFGSRRTCDGRRFGEVESGRQNAGWLHDRARDRRSDHERKERLHRAARGRRATRHPADGWVLCLTEFTAKSDVVERSRHLVNGQNIPLGIFEPGA